MSVTVWQSAKTSAFSWLKKLLNDPAVRTAVLLFIFCRIVTLVIATAAVNYVTPHFVWENHPISAVYYETFTTQGPLRPWLAPWYRYDTGWYIFIAHDGYAADTDTIIYPPLYPLAIKLLAPLVGQDYLVAALLVSNACWILMIILFYKLVAEYLPEANPRFVALLYVSFPAAFYFLAGYTEAMFMTFVFASWLAARRQRYLLAGVLAFLAALTRTQGWVLAFPLGYIAYYQSEGHWLDFHQIREVIRRSPVLIGGPLGTALYVFGMQLVGLGNVTQVFETSWQTSIRPPWESVLTAVRLFFGGQPAIYDLANTACLIFVVILGLVALKYLKPDMLVYIWLTVPFILMRNYTLYLFHGMIRYTLDFFPVFIVLGLLLGRAGRASRAARISYLVIAWTVQIFLLIIFVEWGWVS